MSWFGWCRRKRSKADAERTLRKQQEVEAVKAKADNGSDALNHQLARLDQVLARVERIR